MTDTNMVCPSAPPPAALLRHRLVKKSPVLRKKATRDRSFSLSILRLQAYILLVLVVLHAGLTWCQLLLLGSAKCRV